MKKNDITENTVEIKKEKIEVKKEKKAEVKPEIKEETSSDFTEVNFDDLGKD